MKRTKDDKYKYDKLILDTDEQEKIISQLESISSKQIDQINYQIPILVFLSSVFFFLLIFDSSGNKILYINIIESNISLLNLNICYCLIIIN